MITRLAPPWARVLAWTVRRLPRGRYVAVSTVALPLGPFVAALPVPLGGARFECDFCDDIAREAFLTGAYEPPVTRVFQHLLRPGGVVVDAGANWGYFSLIAAAAVGPSGKVFALEPDPRHAAQLTRNVHLNAFGQVEALAMGAAARPGLARLVGYADGVTNRGVSRLTAYKPGDGRPVPCVAVDDLTATRPVVDLVKIDVEGAELDVLEGMRAGLAARRYRAIVLELHPVQMRQRGAYAGDCVRLLAAAGYSGWTIDLSPAAYRGALSPPAPVASLLKPMASWENSDWPHLLWLAPGVERP